MLTRISLLSLLAVLVAIALASPPPPTPTPTLHPELDDRQLDSIALSIISVATSKVGGVLTTVESAGGKYYTIVSEKGGSVITLATQGVVTSFFGSHYTILPSTGSALSLGLQTPLLVGLVTVMLSTLLGAIIVA